MLIIRAIKGLITIQLQVTEKLNFLKVGRSSVESTEKSLIPASLSVDKLAGMTTEKDDKSFLSFLFADRQARLQGIIL